MKVLVIFGTRLEAIKIAPVVSALLQAPDIETRVCVTAQPRQMLHQVLELFDIRPDFDLNIMQPGQTLSEITSNILLGLREILSTGRFNFVFVHGDTTTTLAASLAAFYAGTPVAHVEAGLRTGNIQAPWPEEMNRSLVGRIASLHLAPTPAAQTNLLRGHRPGDHPRHRQHRHRRPAADRRQDRAKPRTAGVAGGTAEELSFIITHLRWPRALAARNDRSGKTAIQGFARPATAGAVRLRHQPQLVKRTQARCSP